MTAEELQTKVQLTEQEVDEAELAIKQVIETEETTEILTAQKVEKIFHDCLCKDDAEAQGQDAMVVKGVVHTVGLNKQRINTHKEEILAMLLELPEEFMLSGKAGGASFTTMCVDKKGRQWTGLQLVMEQLYALGKAIGRIKVLLPEALWPLAGGVPYLAIIDQEVREE